MNTASSGSYVSYLLGKADGVHAIHILEQEEMCSRICREMINELVPPMVEEVSLKVIKEFLNSNLNGSLNYDIHNIATLSIKDFNSMIQSDKWSKFISDAVSEEIRKRLDEINLTIKL